MGHSAPFVLLDDARPASAAADALLYEAPTEVFRASHPEEVEAVLAAAEAALRGAGAAAALAGYIAYEAGLALEPRLAPLAAARAGAAGPLVWLGLFAAPRAIPAPEVPAFLAARAGGPGSIGPLTPQLSPGGYGEAFAALKAAIHAGDIYQANLTYALAGSFRGDPLAIYAALRAAAGAGYGGLVFDGAHWLLSFSPELFFALQGDGVKVKPMKGTRPRPADPAAAPEADAAMAAELAASAKDRAENLMIVDLMRNDLARVAEPGSVVVEAPFAIETYPTVHQMVSTVRARLAPGRGAMDLVKALFPCGSITGAPKIRAMELLVQAERDARGAYCGAIGRIDAPDEAGLSRAAFNVAIRTLRLTPIENGQGRAVLGVGSAVVADSEAMAERRECEVKAGFVRRAGPEHSAPAFDLIETMRFAPEHGIALLEAHLARMKASAAALGFAFDRHALRNQIQALCFELEAPAMVRLLLARSGAVTIETGPLPAPLTEPVRVAALPHPLDPGDWRLAHKTSERGFYEDALAAARLLGADEALLVRGDGLVTEGSWTSLFAQGSDGVLLTPPASLGLLPGVLRGHLLGEGRAREAALTLADLESGFFIGNALRGLMRAVLV
ncbi:aminodeoxychorismate synthase component I [Erythrobacter cryptus]|uniref:aminodeoxychorismate synthase component I n=1 Tax=Erythrobacter cryptus TaxID=196588 RepID=UPI0003F8D928|nr:aminodeoxychorismate synthase component I [Erythrobacter cryptus]